jgi:hypothetical protein
VFSIATHGAPGRPNEDAVVATPGLAVVVDGAGVPFGGCLHGVAWYARRLAASTTAALVDDELSLREGLAAGIAAVADLHRTSCDLSSGSTPCAAVGILRVGDELVEALALSDVTVAVETEDGVSVTCDLSIENHSGAEPTVLAGLVIGSSGHAQALRRLVERQTATRNREDGWWVAAADPAAAGHAMVNTYPREALRRVVVLSDGATRPVDQMGLYSWPDYLDLLDTLGPTDLIARIRKIELGDPLGRAHPRTKVHDDATIAAADLGARPVSAPATIDLRRPTPLRRP